jgi:HrpA-like RNA helicase
VCIRLYSRLQWNHLAEYQLPEMLRVPLEPLCLQVKATLPDRKVEDVLANALSPPGPELVERPVKLLTARQALDGNGNLTALGEHLSRIPLDPAVGVLIPWPWQVPVLCVAFHA